MPALDPHAPVLAIALLAGLVQGLTGFGSGLVAVPLLALVLPVETLVPLMVLLGLLISAYNLLHLHRAIDPRPVLRLLAGYLVGTPLGLLFLKRAPEGLVLGALGLLISAYALLALAGREPRARWLRDWRLALGALSGALGAAFSTNGPPVILHVAAHREWGPDRQKAALALFFLLSGGITLVAHALGGLVTREVLYWWVWATPALLLGAWAGVRLYRRLGEQDYRRLTFGLILASGLLLAGRVLS